MVTVCWGGGDKVGWACTQQGQSGSRVPPGSGVDVVVKYLSGGRGDCKEGVHKAAAADGLTPRVLKLTRLPGGRLRC